MEKELLIRITQMWKAQDKEMQNFANEIFFGSNPSCEDIETINEINGHPPLRGGEKEMSSLFYEHLGELSMLEDTKIF